MQEQRGFFLPCLCQNSSIDGYLKTAEATDVKGQTFEERLFGAKCIDSPIACHYILLTFYSPVITEIWSRLQQKNHKQ